MGHTFHAETQGKMLMRFYNLGSLSVTEVTPGKGCYLLWMWAFQLIIQCR